MLKSKKVQAILLAALMIISNLNYGIKAEETDGTTTGETSIVETVETNNTSDETETTEIQDENTEGDTEVKSESGENSTNDQDENVEDQTVLDYEQSIENEDESIPEGEEDYGVMTADVETTSFMGQIKWVDTENGWNELIRPTSVPSDPNELVTLWKYTGESTDGATQVTLQSVDPNAANYCKITATEGESIWSYTIGNVASAEGDNFYVKGPAYGSYKASDPAVLKQVGEDGYDENQLKFNYINYKPDFQQLTITKNLIPDNPNETGTFSFTVNVTKGENTASYKGGYTVGEYNKSTTQGKIEGVGGGASAVLQIPLGVSYEVTENNAGSYIVSYDSNKTGTMVIDGNTTVVKNISNNVKVSMNKKWNDNNDPTRNEVAFLGSLKFEYKLDEGDWTVLNADTQKTLGIEGTLSYEIDKKGFSNWTVNAVHGSSKNFPAALVTEVDGTQKVQIISYRITEESLDGYISQIADDGTVTNIKSEDFKATISWKDIDDKDNRPESVEMTLTAYYIDGDGTRHELSKEELEAFGASGRLMVPVSKDKTETDVNIESLPAYSSEGYPITYYINEETLENYSTTYNNGETAYGTNVTQCYNGGTITNTRRDFTSYTASKQWVDADGDKNLRPIATVYLYRYKKGSDPDTASPVVVMDNSGKSHVISMTLPEDSNYKIAFDDILADIDKETGGHNLFKYDGDGSEYIYFVKEVLTAQKDEHGNRVSAPYYKEYKNVGDYADKTDALYEGGTLVNSRIPMVDVQFGKSWKTASLPDVANGTEVTLKLKVSSDDGTTWTYVQDDKKQYLTVTLSGFSADQLTRTQVVTLPKVNEEGVALLYQVEETSVKKNGTEILSDNGTMTIDGHTYTFVATTLNMTTVEEPAGFDENATAELIGENRLSDEADYTVVKNWVGFENDEEKEYVVTVQVNRYLYDGTLDDTFEPINYELTSSKESANNFKHVFKDLPLYDENGYRYDYRTSEVSVTKNGGAVTKDWGTTYDYNYDLNNKKVTATLTNYRGEGGKYITVSKQWKDDGDTQHRLPVVVQVYDSKGNEWEGKTITLSETNGWTARLGFEKDELNKYNEGITVREVSVGGYAVTYGDDVPEAYGDYVNDEYTGVVCTDESTGYIYKVKNEGNDDGSWVITNVRVGEVKVEIDKNWQDGNRTNTDRPEVSVTLYQNGDKDTAKTITLTTKNLVKDDNNKWVLVTDSLLKYDADGKQYIYTIEEVDTKALKEDQYVSQLEDGDYDTSASKYHSGDVQHFTLTNKREGVKDYTVYKIWKDPEGTTSRPDIRISLYYSIGNDATVYAYGNGPLADYQTEEIDYVWSTSSDIKANYDRMCTVPDLMAYSPEDGSEINYYSQETMAVPGDYKTYYWPNSSCEGSVSHVGYAGEGQFIENRTEAKININGTKLWMNLQNGTKVSDLDTSNIFISLYRYVGSKPDDFETKPDKYFVQTINLGDLKNDNRRFLFQNVAKYDENGKLYTYQMREVIDGNMGYVYRNDPNGFQITNTFVTGPENNRTIKVTKNWDSTKYTAAIASSKNTTFTYPKVTYELYRSTGKSDKDNDIDYSAAPIATITVTTAQGQQSAEGTFPAQLIWSENGIQYKYAVKEKTDGMPSYVIPVGEQTIEITDTVYSPTAMPADKTAKFKNTYEPKAAITLKGSKNWVDENNVNCRPNSLTLHVYRRANGTSASTAIAEQELKEGTDFTVTWTNNDKTHTTWEYAISGDAIVQYSPNGQAFTYRIEEEVPEKYTGSGQAVQSGNVTAENVQNMTEITNSLNGTYTVTKVWDDNNNEYALRPTSVVVALQKSENSTDWEYVTTSNNSDKTKTPLYEMTEKIDENTTVTRNVLAVRLSYSANKWSYTFPYLDPTCQYRGVEIAAGVSTGQAEETTYPYYLDTENGRKPMIGSYSIEYSYDDANKKTTVTNKLDPTTLNVTKTWVDDSDDAYDTRPKNAAGVPTIHVTLQRAYNDAVLSNDDSWSDVLDASGKTVTQTLSSSTNGFTWEIKNLPKCDYSGRGYVYRAREVETKVQSYKATYSEPNANVTYITNTLKSPTSVGVNKIWCDGETEHPKVTIELTKWINNDSNQEVQISYPNPMTIVLDGTKDTVTDPYGKSDLWKAIWEKLPTTTNDGKTITYKVKEIKIGDKDTETAAFAADGSTPTTGSQTGLKGNGYLVDVGQTVVAGGSTQNITNTKEMVIQVTKTFTGDTYATRPTSITVMVQRKLASDSTDANWKDVREVVLGGFNDTTASNSVIIRELPKYDSNNKEYTYRVVETKIGDKTVVNNFASGYDVTYSSEPGEGAEVKWNISNTLKTINITGDKEWDDQDNYYGLRPSGVTLELFTGTGTNLAKVTKQPKPTWTKNGNTWTYTFSDLPQYDASGNRIAYTVKETSTTTGYSIENNELTGDFTGAKDSTATAKTTVTVSGTYNGAVHGIINKLETVNVTGKKTWTNTTNGSGVEIQPNGITLALKNGTTTVNVPNGSYTAPTAANTWTYKYEAVPKYGSDGKEITYTVEETEVPGYKTSYSDGEGGTKNVTNTLDTTTVTAVKIWDDQNNVYNMRPANWNITTATAEIDGKTYNRLFSVYADGVKMATQPTCTWTQDENDANKYTFKVENLQQYKLKADGTKDEIVYTVVEEDASVPKGYTRTVEGTTITNKLDTVSIAVNKTFAGDTYATRPTSVTFALMRSTDGTNWSGFKTQEVKGFSSTVATKSYTFADVPKYDMSGKLYQYKVVETKIGDKEDVVNNFASVYDVTYVKADATATTPDTWTVTNTMRTIDITGNKEWDDQSNYYGLRPENVTLELFTGTGTNLTTVTKQPEPTWTKNGNTWTYTFSDLPQYDASGNKIVYTVMETSTPTGYTIVNNELTGDFTGAKDSTATSKKTVTVSGTYNGAAHGIINKLDTVNVTGTKTWSDNKNGSVDSIRPANIALTLKNGETPVSVPDGTLKWTKPEGGNVWSYRFANVPKFDRQGKEITYKVEEAEVLGYTTTYDEAHKNITNTLDVTSLEAVKIWEDQSNAYGTRPSGWNNTNGTGLFTVYAGNDMMTTQPECTWTQDTTNENKWTFKVDNLQKYNSAGKEIVYTVKEKPTPGYTQTESVDGTTKIKTITNTLTTVSHTVTVDFANDENATRPTNVTVKLQMWDGEKWVDVQANSAIVTQDITGFTDGESCTFENLPKYDQKGFEITYRVVETKIGDAVVTEDFASGYDVSYNYATSGTSAITNTMRTINVTSTKVWDDQSNIYGKRPESVTMQLYTVSGDQLNPVTKPEPTWEMTGNSWTFTFSGLPQYDVNGNRIEYVVKETSTSTDYAVTNNELTGTYDAVVNGETVTLINEKGDLTNVLNVTMIRGVIVDVDANKADIKRPVAGVTLGLFDRDGNPILGLDGNQITVVTNEKGEYAFSGVPAGDYLIKEVDAPDGYLINGDLLIEVNVPAITESSKPIQLDEIVDTPASSQLQLLKKDNETGEPIANVEFTIRGKDFRGNEIEKTLLTDENGYLSFGIDFTCSGLPVGEYTLTETRPSNYETPLSYTVVVTNKENGGTNETEISVTPIQDGAEALEATEGVYTIVNNRIRRVLEFTAVGTDDELDLAHSSPISGASYGVFLDPECTIPLKQLDGTDYPYQVSGEDGRVSFAELPEGTYYIAQLKAPNNYMQDPEVYLVTVSEVDGVHSSLYNPNNANSGLSVNQAIRGRFFFVKRNSLTGYALQGSRYTLYKLVNDQKVAIMDQVTDENGEISFENLLIGTEYILEESEAPEGYQVSLNPVEFEYELNTEDQTAELKITDTGLDESGSTVTVDEDGVITWHEPPVCVEISKVDEDGNTVIGAYFRLLDENGEPLVDAEGNVLEWTSEEEAKRIDGILIADHKYILEELSAPDGYVTTNRLEFVAEKKKVGNEVYVQEVKMCNYATYVLLEKTDMSNQGLNGAMFLLEGKLADGTRSFELDFKDLTEIDIKGLLIEGESYTLTETKAPKGYVKLEDPITFDFKENNEIELTSSNSQVTMDKEFNKVENRWICTIHVSNKKVPDPAQVVDTSDHTSFVFWGIMNLSSLLFAGLVFLKKKSLI